jgi:hypothetical protein
MTLPPSITEPCPEEKGQRFNAKLKMQLPSHAMLVSKTLWLWKELEKTPLFSSIKSRTQMKACGRHHI